MDAIQLNWLQSTFENETNYWILHPSILHPKIMLPNSILKSSKNNEQNSSMASLSLPTTEMVKPIWIPQYNFLMDSFTDKLENRMVVLINPYANANHKRECS